MWVLIFIGWFGASHPPVATPELWNTLLYAGGQPFSGMGVDEATIRALDVDFQQVRNLPPHPTDQIFYEGLLNTDPRRIQTEIHLRDMDRLSLFYWYYELKDSAQAIFPMKQLALAWVSTYVPTGNPINENKLVPLIYAYPLLSPHLNKDENTRYRDFLSKLAKQVRDFPKTPMNNWETKRIHLLGVTGLVLGKADYTEWAESRFRNYVDLCLFPDGSSSDIRQRDALSYHVSALKPLCQFLIYLEALQPGKGSALFSYSGSSGGSLQQSLRFVLPYAKGEAVYAQWNNTKVALDRQRAKAGLAEYQPGVLYQAQRAWDTLAMGSFFDRTLAVEDCRHMVCQFVQGVVTK
ncbi:alginate lyase family protein [Lunatimonas salinarum]|uniref:alginate lyase family protein n=1 Tax=Lunatimonas salinarum TaxID=1774590 RepID=UPI001AE05D8E|nr:alginate lyase family protein [Lunatimonas salinarum]